MPKDVEGLNRRLVRSNGCGSDFSIDWALKGVGESVIISCCNTHDNCYDTCGKTQSECDNDFRDCLNQACDRLNGNGFDWWINLRRAACRLDGNTLFTIVNIVGSTAYNNAQSRCP